MKIQGILDLSGFELQNFCIQNYTDKANVANLGRGRKFFFTGNSTDQDYHRELIYDGSSWRATAYLDDIDKINKKLDLIFGDELDTDTIIDSWKEVQDFLSGIEDTKNLMAMLDGKLDTKGGKMTGVLTISNYSNSPLVLNSTASTTRVEFLNNNTRWGYLGFSALNTPAFINDGGGVYALIHKGNVGEYTAGAANRLANKVSLWGNEFDGTQSLNGSISFKDGDKLRSVLDYVNNSEFHLGYGTRTLNLTIWGTPIYFYVNSTRAMTITDGGNVLVGVASQTNTDFKFEVSGLSRIYTAGQSMSLGKVPTNGLVLGSSSGLQGQFYFDYNGNICLQGQSVSDSTTRALNLNPLGGAVNVGEGGLNVNGIASVATTLTVGASDGTSPATIFLQRASNNYIWANKTGGTIHLGVVDSGNISNANASLSIASDKIYPGLRNNAVSLGTSTYRWSDVYSVGGNFSGRVLIGGAEDDGESALQVVGGLKVSRSANTKHTYLNITSVDNYVNYFGADSDDGFCSHRFSSNGNVLMVLSGLGTSYIYTNLVLNKTFNVAGLATFNGGALIPTGQKLTIGDATIEYDSNAKAIKVDGNMYTTGTNASGGVADAQQGGTGGNAEVYKYDLDWGEQVYKIQNVKGDVNVNVQVYEWNGNGNSWDMILTDVSVTANIITVTFGSPTSVDHMVTVV